MKIEDKEKIDKIRLEHPEWSNQDILRYIDRPVMSNIPQLAARYGQQIFDEQIKRDQIK